MASQINSDHAALQGLVDTNPLVNEHLDINNKNNFRDSVRDAVHTYVKSGAKVVDPTSLTNIIDDVVGNPIVKLNSRMDRIEVTLMHILKGINNITAGQGVASGDLVEKLDKVENTVKKVAAIIPKMSNVLINHLDLFQFQIDEAIRTFGERMARMQTLQLHHLMRLNDREQRSRSWSIRVHNFVDFTKVGAGGRASGEAGAADKNHAEVPLSDDASNASTANVDSAAAAATAAKSGKCRYLCEC